MKAPGFSRALASICALGIALTVSVLAMRPTQAVASATTTTTEFSATFQSAGQSMWGPNTSTDVTKDVTLIGVKWAPEPLVAGSIAEFPIADAKFGATLTASTHGSIGLTVHFHMNLGSISVVYPVTVRLTAPAAKSFKPGDTVTISSAWTPPDPNGWSCSSYRGTATCRNRNGASVSTVTPQVGLQVIGNLDFHVTGKLKACFIACFAEATLAQLDIGPFGPAALAIPIPGPGGSPVFTTEPTIGVDRVSIPSSAPVYGVSGSIGGPLVDLASAGVSGDGTLSAGGTVAPVDLRIDAIEMVRKAIAPTPIPPLHVSGSSNSTSFDADLVSIVEALTLQSQRAFTLVPNLQVSLELPAGVNVAYTVRRGTTAVGGGTGNVLTFGANDAVEFMFPRGMTQPLPLSPKLTLNNTFTNASTTSLTLAPADNRIGSFSLSVPPKDYCLVLCVSFKGLTFSAGPVKANFIPTVSTDFGGIFDGNKSFTLGGFDQFVPRDRNGVPLSIILDPKHPLTVTSNSQSRVYGDANPALTGSISGFDPGDAGSITVSFGTAADPRSPVGSYPITPVSFTDPLGKLGKYYIVENYGSLVVTPAPLSIGANDASRLYGAANPVFSGTVTGIRNADPITASFDATGTAPSSDVGTYPIIGTLSDPNGRLRNYTVTVRNGTLTVNPAPLVVTADNQSRAYGTPDPTLTATLSGFANGEGLATSDVRGSAACTSGAIRTSDVAGSPYVISCSQGTLASRHYRFASFRDGSLQIVPAGTRTVLTSAPNPGLEGLTVSLRATVTSSASQGLDPGATSSAGSVTFLDSGTTLGSASPDAASIASLTTTSLTAGTHQLSAAFSGNGNYLPSASPALAQGVRYNRIAFASTRDGASEIYLMKGDGTAAVRLTFDGVVDTQPVLSPDGTRIAFVSLKAGMPNLYIMQADGSGVRQLTAGMSIDNSPSWSPDGSQIVFSSNREGAFHLYLVRSDGTGAPVRLTNDLANDTTPAWSPGGKSIAFTRAAGFSVQLYRILTDGSGLTLLSTSPAIETAPAWSPDGTQIAFTSMRFGLPAVLVMNADGTNARRLTSHGFAVDATPSWSPDGGRLAYTSTMSGSIQIRTVNADGSGDTAITADGGSNALPSWTTPAVP